MLSRSAKAAAQGRAILSPLSPLTSAHAPYAPRTRLSVNRPRAAAHPRKGKSANVSRLHISGPSSPKTMSPTTAAAMGFDASMMERLQTVLASPFSPKTFARSILSPALKTPEAPARAPPLQDPRSSGAIRVGSLKPRRKARPAVLALPVPARGTLKPRRKAPPAMLSLPQPARYTEATPLSPLRYPGLVAARSPTVPMSPSNLLAHVSPVTTLTEAQIRSQKMEKLTRCLGETVPKELVYSSFGQVTEVVEKNNVGSYLELYRTGSASVDDSAVGFKSPAPKDAHREAVGMGAAKEVQRSGSKRSLRRSRSLGDFYSVADIRELQSHNAKMASLVADAPLVESPTGLTSPITFAPSKEDNPVVKRRKSISHAKAAIIGTDARLMAQFRLDFGAPSGMMPASPLSPSLPSALLHVTSPRAPYWVRPAEPKTPRTLRTERRMGWGGVWHVGSMAQMMDQLKEM